MKMICSFCSPEPSNESSRRSSIDEETSLVSESSAELMANLENVSLTLMLGRRHSVPLSLESQDVRMLGANRRKSFPRIERTRWSVATSKPSFCSLTALDRLTDMILTVDSDMKVKASQGRLGGMRRLSFDSIIQQPKLTTLTSVYESSQLSLESDGEGEPNRGCRMMLTPPTVNILTAQEPPNNSESNMDTPVYSDNRLSVDRSLLYCRRSSDPGQNKTSLLKDSWAPGSPRRSSEPYSPTARLGSGFLQRSMLHNSTCREPLRAAQVGDITVGPERIRISSEYLYRSSTPESADIIEENSLSG